jgi:hypothetical protein
MRLSLVWLCPFFAKVKVQSEAHFVRTHGLARPQISRDAAESKRAVPRTSLLGRVDVQYMVQPWADLDGASEVQYIPV